MPYIKQERRKELADNDLPENAGELNYAITMLVKKYVNWFGDSYQTYNDVLGALEGAKLEFYRRVVEKYEDKKIEKNGDVY